MTSMSLSWETEQDRDPGGGRSWAQADRVAWVTSGHTDRDWGALVKEEGCCVTELTGPGVR